VATTKYINPIFLDFRGILKIGRKEKKIAILILEQNKHFGQ
jgi:hypothetical protein